MPLFTRENAAMMAKRSNVAREMRKQQAAMSPEFMPQQAEEEHRKVLCEQIEILDKDIRRTRNALIRCRLIAAKAKLWTLLYPETTRGKSRDRAPSMAPVAPLPVVKMPALVSPISDETHNEQNIQSQVVG